MMMMLDEGASLVRFKMRISGATAFFGYFHLCRRHESHDATTDEVISLRRLTHNTFRPLRFSFEILISFVD